MPTQFKHCFNRNHRSQYFGGVYDLHPPTHYSPVRVPESLPEIRKCFWERGVSNRGGGGGPSARKNKRAGPFTTFRSTPIVSSRLISYRRPSVSRPSRSSAVTTRAFPVCIAFRRPFRPGLWSTSLSASLASQFAVATNAARIPRYRWRGHLEQRVRNYQGLANTAKLSGPPASSPLKVSAQKGKDINVRFPSLTAPRPKDP